MYAKWGEPKYGSNCKPDNLLTALAWHAIAFCLGIIQTLIYSSIHSFYVFGMF